MNISIGLIYQPCVLRSFQAFCNLHFFQLPGLINAFLVESDLYRLVFILFSNALLWVRLKYLECWKICKVFNATKSNTPKKCSFWTIWWSFYYVLLPENEVQAVKLISIKLANKQIKNCADVTKCTERKNLVY